MFWSRIFRSEPSTTNADESKRIRSLLNDLQDELGDARITTDNKLESMGSTITDLQLRFTEIENRFDRYFKEMKEVSSIDFVFVQHRSFLNVSADKTIIELDDDSHGQCENE